MIFILAALAVAAPDVPSPHPTGVVPIIVEGQKAPKQRRVCVSETPTGSAIPHRTCRTVAEWEENSAARARYTQEALKQLDEEQRTTHIFADSPR